MVFLYCFTHKASILYASKLSGTSWGLQVFLYINSDSIQCNNGEIIKNKILVSRVDKQNPYTTEIIDFKTAILRKRQKEEKMEIPHTRCIVGNWHLVLFRTFDYFLQFKYQGQYLSLL